MHELLESWGVSSKTEATLGVSQANSLIAFLFTFPLDTEDFGLLGCQSYFFGKHQKKKEKKILNKVGRKRAGMKWITVKKQISDKANLVVYILQ